MKTYKAICLYPLCPRKNTCIHGKPHPFDEEECIDTQCGMLDGPHSCDLVVVNDLGEVVETIPILYT